MNEGDNGTKSAEPQAPARVAKISVDLTKENVDRVRFLAHTHRLSVSSICEAALTMFFARGNDQVLGIILRDLGATPRRKQGSKDS